MVHRYNHEIDEHINPRRLLGQHQLLNLVPVLSINTGLLFVLGWAEDYLKKCKVEDDASHSSSTPRRSRSLSLSNSSSCCPTMTELSLSGAIVIEVP